MHMYYSVGNYIYSLYSMTTNKILIWQTYFGFYIYANNFRHCTHKGIMPIEYSLDSLKYFTIISHIYSFTPRIPLLSHVWQSCLFFTKAYEDFTASNKHFTFGSHICSFTSMIINGFLLW